MTIEDSVRRTRVPYPRSPDELFDAVSAEPVPRTAPSRPQEIVAALAARRHRRRSCASESPLVSTWKDDRGEARASLHVESGVPVVALRGPVDELVRQPMADALGAALKRRPERVVLDLSAATHDAESGLDLMLEARRYVGWHGARLDLACAPDDLLDELELIGAGGQVAAHENVAVALAIAERPPLSVNRPPRRAAP